MMWPEGQIEEEREGERAVGGGGGGGGRESHCVLSSFVNNPFLGQIAGNWIVSAYHTWLNLHIMSPLQFLL